VTWDNLDGLMDEEEAKKANAEKRREQAELAQAYHRVFEGPDGERVLQDLTTRFVWENNTSLGSQNIEYEAAYHNGEGGVVKYIANQISQAAIL
jgi:hypothetical protein